MDNVNDDEVLKNCGYYNCPSKNPIIVLDHLLKLKSEAITKEYLFRQMVLIDQFLFCYRTPFVSFFSCFYVRHIIKKKQSNIVSLIHVIKYLAHLPPIMELMEKLVEDIQNVPQYNIPLQLLFEKAEKLPLLRCSSDEINCGEIFQDYLNMWGKMLYL